MEQTRDQPDKIIRFFKIMVPGHFELQLKLPPKFCRKMKDDKTQWAILEGCKGKFRASVRRDSGLMRFDLGWPRFVAANGLSEGDCLVFEHTQHLHFIVSVFGASSMLKHSLDHPTNHYQHCCSIPGFNVEIKPYTATTKAKVCIPMEFMREFGLQQKPRMKVRDDRERSWRIKIQDQHSAHYMTGGWRAFYEGNQLQIGDVCRFELDTDSLSVSTPLFRVKIDRRHEN